MAGFAQNLTFMNSLRAKVNITVFVIFLLVLALVTTFAVTHEHQRLLEAAEIQVKELTTVYFDSLNMLMLIGAMDQRTILRDKMQYRKEVVEARVIRGQPVARQFGPGFPEEQPVDELDRRALKGEEIVLQEVLNGKHVLTVLTPFKATENTRNVNCLRCHNVHSGDINGAVRISYSLANIEKAVSKEVWTTVVFNIVLFLTGMILVNLLLKTWIINPLTRLINVVNKRAEGDTGTRAFVTTKDEIGELGVSFNTMADNVNAIAQREHDAADELRNNVDHLLQVVSRVTEGDFSKRIQVAGDGAMGELAASLQAMIDNISGS
ncbi:MAG: HAMP domain-containing protein, partial [Gammaproteobacteria bacterium]